MKTTLVLVLIAMSLGATSCATTGTRTGFLTDEVGDPSPHVKWENGVTEDTDGTIWVVGCHQLLGPAQESFAWTWASERAWKEFDAFQKKAAFWYGSLEQVWRNNHAKIEGQMFVCTKMRAKREEHK